MRWSCRLTLVLALFVAVGRTAPARAADDAMSRPADKSSIATRAPTPIIVAHPDLFTEDDLLLFEIDIDGQPLTDSFGAYSSRAGVFLPLGALSRLLDLPITVDAARGKADGWVVDKNRTVRLDMQSQRLELGDKVVSLSGTEAATHADDIYLRSDLIEKVLPIRLKIDPHSLVIALTPTQKLPFQEREEREKRHGQLGGGQAEPALIVPAPYALFSPPSVEMTLAGTAGNHAQQVTGSYELRAAGDLAYADGQLYAGSNQSGRLTDLRLLLERKDPDGHAAGPLGLTRMDLGDTFTPQLSVGARSGGGRGFAVTSAPLEQADVFNKVDLRGELPVGYEVELYIGEVLRGSQSQPVDGRYQFLAVNLAYGLNVIRLVFYGPHGERREEVQRVNVGGGQLARNQTTFSVGLVQQDVPTIDILRQPLVSGLIGAGDLRLVADIAHGLTSTTTVTAGFAHYSPTPNGARDLGVLGLVTSLDGMAAKVNVGLDDTGASDLSLGLAGQRLGVSFVARHSEYGGDFLDEQISTFAATGPSLRRDDRLDLNYSPTTASRLLPLQLSFERTERVDGSAVLVGSAETSRPVNRFLVSSSLNYSATTGGPSPSSPEFGGSFAVSGLVDGHWEVRAASVYAIEPQVRLDSVSLAADRQIGERLALHFGVDQQLGTGAGTLLQMTDTVRLSKMDLSLTSSYATNTHDFRVGFQVTLGFGFDPIQKRYRSLGPGAASGGAMAIQAFRDTNGDGVKQAGEPGIPGITADGGRRAVTSDAQGELMVTGLGDGTIARVRLQTDALDDPYLSGPPTTLTTVPRPGHIARVAYPMTNSSEVELTISFQRPGEAPRGLSALTIQALDASGAVAAQGRTEYDGTLLLEGLKTGAYSLRIDPEEAQRLHMALKAPVSFKAPPAGGYIGEVAATVVLTTALPAEPPRSTPQTPIAAPSPPGANLACCQSSGKDVSRSATGGAASSVRPAASSRGAQFDIGIAKRSVPGHGRRGRHPAGHLRRDSHDRNLPVGATADRAAAGPARTAIDRASAWRGALCCQRAQAERGPVAQCGRPVAGSAPDRAAGARGWLRDCHGQRPARPSAVVFADRPDGPVGPVAVRGRDRAWAVAEPGGGRDRPGARRPGRDRARPDQEPDAQDGPVQSEATGRPADARGRGPGLISSTQFGGTAASTKMFGT